MLLSGSDFYRAYRPSECDIRLYLHHRGIQGAEPGPFEEVIRRLVRRHERAHFATFQNVTDLSQGSLEERHVATLEALSTGATVIYQPVFLATAELGGRSCELVGIPDFLIREGEDYVIRDVKISRRITHSAHPEILRQLRLYGWLFALAAGRPPPRLEVFNGKSEIVPVEAASVAEKLAHFAGLIESGDEPFEPVGWSRCYGCTYYERCWGEAEARHDVALVLRVDKNLTRALRDIDIVSYDDLLEQFDEAKLSTFEKPWGQKTQKVGRAAAGILLSARALQSKTPIALAPPAIPDVPNLVMFDLEGLPPHLDELEKIYLWGLQVYGEKPSPFIAATAGFGPHGDQEGWDCFLSKAAEILTTYGDIQFVHWSLYEKTKLKLYIDRYGDPNGIAAAVLSNLFDLLPVAQESVMLPLASYSLKVVEEYVGFQRTQDEYGGTWAMAQYIEATETEDEVTRNKLVDEILKYNEEDLAATCRSVRRWVDGDRIH